LTATRAGGGAVGKGIVFWPALQVLAVTLAFAVLFGLWRLVLLVALGDKAAAVPAGVLVSSFLVGFRFDLSTAGYLGFLLLVVTALPGLDSARFRGVRIAGVVLAALLAGATSLAHVADIEFFRFFNARLNGMALQWADTPQMVGSMLWGMFPVFRYLLLIAVVTVLFTWGVIVMNRHLITGRPRVRFLIAVLWFLAASALLLLSARGRLERKAVMRWGAAYFSEYDFANQLALNPTFTFLRDAVYDRKYERDVEEIVRANSIPEFDSVTRRLLGREAAPGKRIHRRVTFAPPASDPQSVVLIIMESFGNTKIGCLDNRYGVDLSPDFDRIAGEGTLFTNVVSTGMHTYAGLFSSIYGHLPFPGDKIFRTVSGKRRFRGLPSILRDHGYKTLFFTTHDPLFDNLQGFMKANGFMEVISSLDYPKSEHLSTWGVPDHVMFDRAAEELEKLRGKRFFATLLTTSNHGPWIVPDVPFERIPGTGKREKELNAFRYSDWALGRFIERLRADPALANTLVVVTADNGSPYEPRTEMDLTQFRIPLLLLPLSAKAGEGRRIDRLGSQADIVATVMGQVRLPYDDYTYGRDLLSPLVGEEFAYIYEWYKIAYLTGDRRYLIRHLKEPVKAFFDLSGRVPRPLDAATPEALECEQRVLSLMNAAYEDSARPLSK
jgi:phosphoglycerol transferase MdoB-like AlkP superfamily enzyme